MAGSKMTSTMTDEMRAARKRGERKSAPTKVRTGIPYVWGAREGATTANKRIHINPAKRKDATKTRHLVVRDSDAYHVVVSPAGQSHLPP